MFIAFMYTMYYITRNKRNCSIVLQFQWCRIFKQSTWTKPSNKISIQHIEFKRIVQWIERITSAHTKKRGENTSKQNNSVSVFSVALFVSLFEKKNHIHIWIGRFPLQKTTNSVVLLIVSPLGHHMHWLVAVTITADVVVVVDDVTIVGGMLLLLLLHIGFPLRYHALVARICEKSQTTCYMR